MIVINNDLISIITTTYNEEKYISTAIESILKQTYTNFELIIVDDGSTDNTVTIIESFKDNRVKLFKLPFNQGVGKAHAFAIEKANGQYIAIADADDIHLEARIEKQLEFLKSHPEIGVVDCKVQYFAENDSIEASERFKYVQKYRQNHVDRVVTPEDYERTLNWYCSVIHSASMFSKDLLKYFTYGNLTIGEDYEIFYNLNKMGIKFAKVPEILVHVRVASNSTTIAKQRQLIENYLSIKKEDLLRLVHSTNKFYIWGTGQGGIDTAQILKEQGLIVEGFLDNNLNKVGLVLEGLPIVNYRDVIDKNIGILVVSSIGKFEIVEQLESFGLEEFKNFMVLL